MNIMTVVDIFYSGTKLGIFAAVASWVPLNNNFCNPATDFAHA